MYGEQTFLVLKLIFDILFLPYYDKPSPSNYSQSYFSSSPLCTSGKSPLNHLAYNSLLFLFPPNSTHLSHSNFLFRRCLFNSPALITCLKHIFATSPSTTTPKLASLSRASSPPLYHPLTSLVVLHINKLSSCSTSSSPSPTIVVKQGSAELERSVEVIRVLAKCKEGREKMELFRGCVQILACVLRNESSKGV